MRHPTGVSRLSATARHVEEGIDGPLYPSFAPAAPLRILFGFAVAVLHRGVEVVHAGGNRPPDRTPSTANRMSDGITVLQEAQRVLQQNRHKADMPACLLFVRFRGQSGHWLGDG